MATSPAPSPTGVLAVDRPADGVARLTLNRPERRNALSVEVRDAMSDTLDALADDDGVSVVVVTGAGSTFSAGFDLTEFDRAGEDPAFDDALWASSERWHQTLRTHALPTIASVNGPALAGGFDLATMCDLRVAGRSAWFARPELAFSPVIYNVLRDLVGGALARELSFTNRRLEAEEAQELGLVTRVVDDADLAEATLDLAREVAAVARDNLKAIKANVIAALSLAPEGELGW
jgi:enoyl-CoA hydratase